MESGLLTSLSTEDGEYGRSSSSSLLTQSPAAFSRRSEAQRVGQGLIRLFARCGLSEQPVRYSPDVRDLRQGSISELVLGFVHSLLEE